MHSAPEPPQVAVQWLHLLVTLPHTLHFNMKWLAPCSHFLFPASFPGLLHHEKALERGYPFPLPNVVMNQ